MKNYSAISEMYYGNRGNAESITISKQEKESLRKLIEIENMFLKEIKDDKSLLEIYEKMQNEQCNQSALNYETAYKEGFRFGFLMAMDILNT